MHLEGFFLAVHFVQSLGNPCEGSKHKSYKTEKNQDGRTKGFEGGTCLYEKTWKSKENSGTIHTFVLQEKVVCGQMAGNDSSEHINDLIGHSETG